MTRPARRKSVIAVVTAVVVLGAVLGGSAVANAGVVLGGITVGGIPVAGLSPGQLMGRLAPAARALERRPMTFFVGKRQWVKSPEAMGITVDLKATATNALMAGRGNSLSLIFQSLSSQERRLPWVRKVDQARLSRAMTKLKSLVDLQASNGDVTLVGSEARVKAPTDGVNLLIGPAKREILKAALAPSRDDRVALPVSITAPEIDHQEALRIQQQAQGILRFPVSFQFQSRILSISPARIAPALRVVVIDDPDKSRGGSSLALQADPAVLREQIIAAAPFVYRAPKDAAFSVSGDTVNLRPGEEGATIDTTAAASALIAVRESNRPTINLPLVVEPPTFTTAQAEALKIGSKISTFTTVFDARNVPRVANIDRMASAINGTVLRPGQVFSLNGATGPRTPANGYQEAQVIVDGELVPGIGGGVCQVATTLFNAVYLAGLDIVERVNHSLYISKYPMGRDATVNYGHQDLRFRNDTEFGLLLKASVSAKQMTVNIYSSPLGRTVTETVSPARNPKVPPVKYIPDPAIPTGTEKVEEQGTAGFDITVTRKVTSGGQTLHSDTFVSKYSPWKRVIKRGTGPAPPPQEQPDVPPTDAPTVG